MTPFTEDLIRYHGDLLNRELSPKDKEMLTYLLEAMTNIDTPEKVLVFEDLCACYSKIDYMQLVEDMKLSIYK